jgi:regulator of RNase E activity RraB
VKILLTRPLSDSNQEEKRVTLIHTTLNILLEIVRSEHKLLGELKKQTTEDNKLLKVLKQLSGDNRNEKVQLKAFELTFLLVPEEEFEKENGSAKVTELFVKNFNEALEDNKDRKAEELMEGLKGQ